MSTNAELLAFQEQYESSARTYPRNLPIAIRSAHGSYVRDMDGKSYLDFLSGAGVLALGHCHPDIVEAIRTQAGVFGHGLDIATPVRTEFMRRLLDRLPETMREDTKVHMCGPTGADAVEAAIKLCKAATGRHEVVAFQGSYHGCSAGAMAVTSLVSMKQEVNGHHLPGVHFMPFSYCNRCPLKLSPENCDTNCVAMIESALGDSHSGFTQPAAVIVELVQGEGGSIPARPDFVRRLRAATQSAGVPLIVDEIQTGGGRTGTWFAFEQYGIEPDVVLLSKALGGGLPVSVMLYRASLDTWPAGTHIGTFRGNQLAFAAGVALQRTFDRDKILENVRSRSQQAFSALRPLTHRLECVAEVRGLGLMIGVELANTGFVSGGELARAVQRECLRSGLIVELGGRDDCVIRLLPPLNIADFEMTRALEILTNSLSICNAAALSSRSEALVDA